MMTILNFRKLLAVVLTSIIFAACTTRHDPVVGETCSETGNNIITIDIGTKNLKYEKVIIKGHECWIRTWSTKYGTGSDILHIKDLCDKCTGKSVTKRGDSGDDDALDY